MKYLWTNYDDETFYRLGLSDDVILEESGVKMPSSTGKYKYEEKVDPRIRLAHIFAPLTDLTEAYSKDDAELEKFCVEIENILLTFIAEVDLNGGNCLETLACEVLEERIKKKRYGERAAKLFDAIDKEQQLIVCKNLWLQERCKSRRLFFKKAIEELFPGSEFYFYYDEDRFLIYIPKEENKANWSAAEITIELFFDVTANPPDIYWNEHFGIIDDDKTMRIDEVVLY